MNGKYLRIARRIWPAAVALVAVGALASCTNPVAGGPTITPIYAATSGGLSVFDGSTWTNYTTGAGLASSIVNGVSVVGSGSTAFIYAATAGGLSANQGSGWQTIYTGAVNAVFISSDNLYLATGSTLTIYNYATQTTVAASPWSPATVKGVFSNGTTYVATTSGLWVSAGGGWTSYTSPGTTGFPSGTVNTVFVDSSSNIYVGTANGLALGTPTSTGVTWSTFAVPGNPAVTSLFVDSYGDIYAGTASGLFVSTDGGSNWLNFTTTDGLGSNTVNGVFVVGLDIYLATAGGVSVSTDGGASWKSYTAADGLGSNAVNGIYVTTPLYSY